MDIKKRYHELEKKLKAHNPEDSFSDLVQEQLELLQELQSVLGTKSLSFGELEELAKITSEISLLFSEKTKEARTDVKKVSKKSK
jgi:hypothetical protein